MEKVFEKIKTFLDSEAGLKISKNDTNEKCVVDNRFDLIKKCIDSTENKDDDFYSNLIELISIYIDKLYDIKIEDFPNIVFDQNGNLLPQNYNELDSNDIFKLEKANQNLSENLFNYVCSILKTNKDIKLNVETLTRLLNRNPKPFTVSVEDSYLYRLFDYKKLVELINDNEIFKKSNISVDDIYQILINAYQIDNEEVFSCLIKTEQFKENNMKVIELLNQCNAKTFVKISDIIVKYIDKDFDILTLVKKRTDKNFIERLIIFILLSHFTENDYLLIHQLLNDKEISLNYNLYYADYFGQSTLKDLLAFSNDRNVLRDLLSKQENIKNCYFNGDWKIQLYTLYAKLGDYEKAIETFAKNYNYSYDFNEDYKDGFKNGQAEGDFEYIDSLVEFVKNICSSFEKDKIDYARQKDIIERILNSQNVRYINIERVLPIIKDYLSAEDFHELLSSLLQRYSVDDIGFITVIENDCFYGRYTIRIATEEEIQNSLAKLKSKNLKLVKKLIPQKNTGNK